MLRSPRSFRFKHGKTLSRKSPCRGSRTLVRLESLEARQMMAGDVWSTDGLAGAIESEYVETSTLDPAEAPNPSAWSLAPMDDLVVASGAEFATQLTVEGDIDPATLTFSATAVPSLAQQLDAEYDLLETDDYHTNCLGQNERWIRSAAGGWFYIMPEGDFFEWRGSFHNSVHLATFDASYYDNPDLLAAPESVSADVQIDGDVLTILPTADYTGSFQVEVQVSNGVETMTHLVAVTAVDPPPEGEGEETEVEEPQAPATPAPVLLVIANQDFYYKEYADTRDALLAAGIEVVVAAGTTDVAIPHWNSGQGADGGWVRPDVALTEAEAVDYSTIIFVGGWGSASYQYANETVYDNPAYNAADEIALAVNNLINDFVAQDKYVAAMCHGTTVLAWARVDGVSLLDGRTVSAWAYNSPSSGGVSELTRLQIEANGATMVASGSIGDPAIAHDDVIVDGRIITAENWDSAAQLGQMVAQLISTPEYIAQVDQTFAEWE